MVKKQPYHKYVFDVKNRRFVGRFEEMYQNEDKGNYDSWFQEDLTHLNKSLSLSVLNRYNFGRILDIGCGKGTFTHLLKKLNNKVVGVDISQTAIAKAKSKYRNIEFVTLPVFDALEQLRGGGGKWDLIIMMEILSYINNWKDVLSKAAKQTNYLYLTLYIPPNPIGFVKSFGELKTELNKHFDIETELLCNNESILILAKRKNKT